MTGAEVREWFLYHQGIFPGWGDMFAANNAAFLETTTQVFERISLFDAKAASRTLYQRETKIAYQWHVKSVAQIAIESAKHREQAKASARGLGETYACAFCRDTGLAPVYLGSTPLRRKAFEVYERNFGMHAVDLALKRQIVMDCFCHSRRRPRLSPADMSRLESVLKSAVPAWQPFDTLTEDEQAACIVGVTMRPIDPMKDEF